MNPVEIAQAGELAVVSLRRGKVNALNPSVIRALQAAFDEAESAASVRAVILTGTGKFFSFGFDVPEFLSFSKDAFIRFLTDFTGFYTRLFVFPKPVIAALNGHAVAGGCMLATACDGRVMASGKGKISLNEITFGASVFAGSVAMLRAAVGQRNAEKILYSGAMYGAEEALRLGLIDQVTDGESLIEIATAQALALASGNAVAFASMKRLLRGPITEEFRKREADAIREFADIWYSKETRRKLEAIKIRG
jgi:enoyl-CoA hydratase/carnithine racemase